MSRLQGKEIQDFFNVRSITELGITGIFESSFDLGTLEKNSLCTIVCMH